MDSSLPKKRNIRKRIFLYLNRVPNIHCVRSAGDLKSMAGTLFFIIEELLDCNIIELQQCLQSSNYDKTVLFLFDGILADWRKHAQCRNFFEFTVPSYSLEE